MILREYQIRAIEQLYNWFSAGNQGHPCLVLPTGCHAAGTKVIMIDGSVRNVEDIVPGDVLMGKDSSPRTVLNLCRGNDEMYLVTPKKGEPFIVNGGHILSLSCTNEGKAFPSSKSNGDVDCISVNDYINKSKHWKHLRKLHRPEHIDFSPRPIPALEPWAVGVLLGDGHIVSTVMICTPDQEIMDGMRSVMSSHGMVETITHKQDNLAVDIRYVDPTANRARPNRVMSILRDMGIAGCVADNKFVPFDLKTGSKSTRLEILAGLIDTDGHYDGRGFDFISKSKQLADDVVFISRSLGLWAKTHECQKHCQTGGGGTYWRVYISGDLDAVPTRVVRKQASPRLQKKDHRRTGFSVEPVGRGDFYGFTLTGDHLYLTEDFIVHHNSGKSVIIAALCRDALQNWPETRILMLTHVRELIVQNAAKMRAVWPNAPLGIYSSGLRKKELGEPITFAGIQSVRTKAKELGYYDICIIDECHLVSHKDEGGYRQLINDLIAINPHLRVVGLTATPWRLGHGRICDNGALFSDLIEPVSIEELLFLEHLAPLRSKRTDLQLDTSGVHKRGGDFIESELQAAVDTHFNNDQAADEIIRRADSDGRKAWLLFCAGVQHAIHMKDLLLSKGITAECVTGDTPSHERDEILRNFKAGVIQAVTNANVLTTGFDYPDIDLIAMLRPTMSPTLYVQMAGRGMRPKTTVKDCLVLDFAGLVEEHGPITNIREPKKKGTGGEPPMKVCPECQEIIHISVMTCPSCGHMFPPPDRDHHTLHDDDIMKGPDPKKMEVTSWKVAPHTSFSSGKDMIRITYYGALSDPPIHEYLTIFHEGYAGEKAARSLSKICQNAGIDMESDDWRAWCDYATAQGKPPGSVSYLKDGKFFRVTGRSWE